MSLPSPDTFKAELMSALAEKRMKEDLVRAARLVQGNPVRLSQILDILPELKSPLRERLAWMVQLICEEYPELIDAGMISRIIDVFEDAKTDAEKRAYLNVLRTNQIPEHKLGEVYDRCFEWFNDPKQALAVRIYALYVMLNIAKELPELNHEIELCVNSNDIDPTPAMFVALRRAKQQLYPRRKKPKKS